MKAFLWSMPLGLGVGAPAVAAPAAPATGDVKEWVDAKVAACAPKSEERRFDETGWRRRTTARCSSSPPTAGWASEGVEGARLP